MGKTNTLLAASIFADVQVSCIYILGGTSEIMDNTFKNHRQEGTEVIINAAPKIFEYAPEGYFELA